MRVLPVIGLVAVLVAATFSFAAWAQDPPFVYPTIVGTSPIAILPQNTARRSVEFCNPNATANCAVCPVRSRGTGNPLIICAVNGAGSVTLPPTTCWGKSATPQESTLRSAWNAVCSLAAQNFTAFETE